MSSRPYLNVPAERRALRADQPLIFFDRGSSDWTLTHGLFRRAGLVPNVALEVETIEIVGAEPISRSLDVIHPRQRPLSAEAGALLSVLRSALADAGGVVRAVRRRARAGAGRA